MALRHPSEDIANRVPVWLAMSDLFLDTEIDELTISYVARICAASPYSMNELEKIMFAEVWPAFKANLLSFCGEWQGWRAEFVQQRVLEFYRPRCYISWRFNPLKRRACKEWIDVERETILYREGKGKAKAGYFDEGGTTI